MGLWQSTCYAGINGIDKPFIHVARHKDLYIFGQTVTISHQSEFILYIGPG